jgi:adenylate cyclase
VSDQFTDGLVQVLRDLGVGDEEIEQATKEGAPSLVALFADHTFVPGAERLTRSEVEERAGISDEDASAFWRALGFPDVPDEEAVFTEVDVEMLMRVKQLLTAGLIERDIALQNTRVMGRAMAQIAASLVDTVRSRLGQQINAPPPALLAAAPTLLENLEHWLIYIWRRHFAAEVKRAAAQLTSNEAGTAIVGFADLVGFTGMSRQLDETELAAAVSAFEATAVDRVGAHGGRIVKMIGDEVMFETPTAKGGADTSLDLVEAFASHERLPDVRAGLAAGPAIRNQGDLFGTAPNLASRLVDQAYPGTILVSDTIHEALKDDPDYDFRGVPPRSLKGFGRTRFWVLRRKGAAENVPIWKVALPKLAEIARVLDDDSRS